MSAGQYISVDELIALNDEQNLIALCGVGGPNSATGRTIDRDRLTLFIARAQSTIDGYVKARFPALAQVTASDMPPSLKGVANDLVIYWLRDRVGDKAGVDDTINTRYRDAIAWLKEVRDGKIDFDFPGNSFQSGSNSTDNIAGAFPEAASNSILEGF